MSLGHPKMVVVILVEVRNQSLLSLGGWMTQQFWSGAEPLEDCWRATGLRPMSETQRECVSALVVVSSSSCSFYRIDAVR